MVGLVLVACARNVAAQCSAGIPPSPNCVPPDGPGWRHNMPAPSGNQLAPTSRKKWVSQWGAVSVDLKQGVMGAAEGKGSRREAERSALASCRAQGGGDGCKLTSIAWHNACGAVASGQSYTALNSNDHLEVAKSTALEECSRHTSDCKVYYSSCSYPVLVE